MTHGKPEGTVTGLGFSAETSWYPVKIIIEWCVLVESQLTQLARRLRS